MGPRAYASGNQPLVGNFSQHAVCNGQKSVTSWRGRTYQGEISSRWCDVCAMLRRTVSSMLRLNEYWFVNNLYWFWYNYIDFIFAWPTLMFLARKGFWETQPNPHMSKGSWFVPNTLVIFWIFEDFRFYYWYLCTTYCDCITNPGCVSWLLLVC